MTKFSWMKSGIALRGEFVEDHTVLCALRQEDGSL